MPETLRIDPGPGSGVGARWYRGSGKTTLLLAHGAGASQRSEFMVRFAQGLAERGLDVVTFDFPYVERGRRVPDPPHILEASFRTAISTLGTNPHLQGSCLFIGGKSMGGRIASHVAARGLFDQRLAGLVLLGYPLHPPGRPQRQRAAHLPQIQVPMLFVQGTRDSLGTPQELRPVIDTLGGRASLLVIEGGDHSFKVLKKSAIPQNQVYDAALDHIAGWVQQVAERVRTDHGRP